MSSAALMSSPLPRFNEHRRRPKKSKRYVPREPRPAFNLARFAALQEDAWFHGQGIDVRIVDCRLDGMCLVYAGDELVSVCVGWSDE